MDECWKILQDDDAWKEWHPEITNIVWASNERKAGATSRTVKFRDPLFMALLAGPIKIWENFDIWEETPTVKRMSFYSPYLNKPNFLSYSALREEFVVEKTGDQTCKFTRKVCVNPSFLNRYVLGFITYPRMASILEQKCPERFKRVYDKKA